MRKRREESELGCKLTTLTGQTEVGTDVDVPLVVHSTLFLDSLEGILVALPNGSTDFFDQYLFARQISGCTFGIEKEGERESKTYQYTHRTSAWVSF